MPAPRKQHFRSAIFMSSQVAHYGKVPVKARAREGDTEEDQTIGVFLRRNKYRELLIIADASD